MNDYVAFLRPALIILQEALRSYMKPLLEEAYGDGWWGKVTSSFKLSTDDLKRKGNTPDEWFFTLDAQKLLAIMDKSWNKAFKSELQSVVRSYVNEVLEERHIWAHLENLSDKEARRIIDTIKLLLREIKSRKSVWKIRIKEWGISLKKITTLIKVLVVFFIVVIVNDHFTHFNDSGAISDFSKIISLPRKEIANGSAVPNNGTGGLVDTTSNSANEMQSDIKSSSEEECSRTVLPSESLQAAIDDAEALDVICLSVGTWTENIRINKALKLRGDSPETTVLEGSVRSNSVPGFLNFSVSIDADSDVLTKVTLENLSISSSVRGGISIGEIAEALLINVHIEDNQDIGMAVFGTASIENSLVSGNERGISLIGEAEVNIFQSKIIGNKTEGIFLQDNSKLTVVGTYINKNLLNGVQILNKASAHIINTVISENGENGVLAQFSSTTRLSLVQILGNKKSGIFLTDKATIRLVETIVKRNTDFGIYSRADFRGQIIFGKNFEITENGIAQIFIPYTDEDLVIRKQIVGFIGGIPCNVVVEPGDLLQEIIDRLPSNTSICLQEGSWEGNFTINKSLTIKGVDRELTLLKGKSSKGFVIDIASTTEIEVRIEDVGITESKRITPAIQIGGHAQVMIDRARIFVNSGSGIRTYPSHDGELVIVNTIIENNNLEGGGPGIILSTHSYVKIKDSVISRNNGYGISILGTPKIEIVNSIISENDLVGIYVEGSANVELEDSKISNNGSWGIAVGLKKCGFEIDGFDGEIVFLGNNIITENKQGDLCLS